MCVFGGLDFPDHSPKNVVILSFFFFLRFLFVLRISLLQIGLGNWDQVFTISIGRRCVFWWYQFFSPVETLPPPHLILTNEQRLRKKAWRIPIIVIFYKKSDRVKLFSLIFFCAELSMKTRLLRLSIYGYWRGAVVLPGGRAKGAIAPLPP